MTLIGDLLELFADAWDLSYMLNLDAGKDKAIVLEAAADSTNELSAINHFVVFPGTTNATFNKPNEQVSVIAYMSRILASF